VIYVLRHMLSVLILPTTVVVLIPVWIAREWRVGTGWPRSLADWVAVLAGGLALAIGLALFVASLLHFAREGRGTLAPWDPPRRLVVRGPYRYVRNPMISGIIFLLTGVALCLRSLPHALWASVFVALNLIVIPLLEEPELEQRFGEDYRAYWRAVPRFVPRFTAVSGLPRAGDPHDDPMSVSSRR
jgi:protein-S-isoprenylcysteine O-methyltransferase Ste14